MPQLGNIHAAQRDDTCVFRLAGEFDLSNAWEIQASLLHAIQRDRRDVVVDLTDVTFMDAQLLRVLIRARTAATRRDVGFVVVPPADRLVGRVAQLIDFDIAA